MTQAFIRSTLSPPTFKAIGANLPDRWYLDFICRRDVTKTTPYRQGSLALTGKGVTIYILSTGVCNSSFFGGRLSWLLGNSNEDLVGDGTGLAFILGARKYGVATRCTLVSICVFDAAGLNLDLYKQGVDLILDNYSTPCLVLTTAIQSPKYGYLVVDADVDYDTKRLLDAGLTVIACAGDGLVDAVTGELKGPILAEAVHPNQFEDVITVGALASDLTLPLFTNYGHAVHAFAPGVDLCTLDALGEFTISSSTRLAAAIVTGILALYLEKFPNAQRAELITFIREHFFNQQLAVPYPLERLQKDPFLTETYGLLGLRTATGFPYHYLTDTQVTCRIAHAFFTRALLEINVIQLGTVLANIQFEIELSAYFVNMYNEHKPLVFELLSYTPLNIGVIELGRHDGKLFGILYDVNQAITCVLSIRITDGLHQIDQDFSLYIQPNYVEQYTVGGIIKANLQNISMLDINSVNGDVLNITSVIPTRRACSVSVAREVRLLHRYTGKFFGKTVTPLESGEFLFTTPMGMYSAVVLDEQNQYNATVLDGLQSM